MRKSTKIAAAVIGVAALTQTAFAEPVKIDQIVTATASTPAENQATLATVKAFYQFWNDGDAAELQRAISPEFIDHTLPPGRPQGPTGPAFASEHFRSAVPDLRVEVRKIIVAGDYVTVHMDFTGHFTGKFGNVRGKGQAISFIATDLLKVTNGKISDNWHIEDNLTLLTKMGVAAIKQ